MTKTLPVAVATQSARTGSVGTLYSLSLLPRDSRTFGLPFLERETFLVDYAWHGEAFLGFAAVASDVAKAYDFARMLSRDYPRMTRDDVKDLKRCAEDLNAIADALAHSTWTGRGPCLAATARAYEVVARLYNRGEPYLLRGNRRGRPEKPAENPSGTLPPTQDDDDPGIEPVKASA